MSAIKSNLDVNDVESNVGNEFDPMASYCRTENRCRDAVLEIIETNSGFSESDYPNHRAFVKAALADVSNGCSLSNSDYLLGANGVYLLDDEVGDGSTTEPLRISPIGILYHRDGFYLELILVMFDGDDLISYEHSCCTLGFPPESAEDIQHELFFNVIDQLIEFGVMKKNDVPSLYLLEYVWSCVLAPNNNLLHLPQLGIPPRVKFVNPNNMSQLNEQFDAQDAA